jgi:uncharacterized membrane protein YfcA
MELWQWAVYAVASFAASVLSGIAGAGGGFIMTPLMIFLGLTPAQAVATGKINGLLVTLGSLAGMRKEYAQASRRKVIPVMVLSLLVGLVVPFVIVALDSQVYRIILGIVLLLMIPVVLLKKMGIKPHRPTRGQKIGGGALLVFALFMQGVFAGGLGTLVNMVLMGMLGMTATEANLTKRWSQLILNIVIVLGVLAAGLIVWPMALVGLPSILAGSYLGGHLAVKKGNQFIINVMVALMAVSAVALIFGA